jgi:hypothetical protein
VRIVLVGPVEDLAVRDIEATSLGDVVEVDRDIAVLVMLKLAEIDHLEDLAVGTGVEHLFGLWVDALAARSSRSLPVPSSVRFESQHVGP